MYNILVSMIERLPKYVTHYAREKSHDNIVYLQPGTVLASRGKRKEASLFHLLQEECNENGVKPPKLTWFRRVMNTKFRKIKIKKPKSDQCNTCERSYLIHADDTLHKERAERLREQQRVDKQLPNCLTFDLQQVQPLPDLLVNKAFYSRKMWIYNLGLNRTKPNQAMMHLWLETEGKRGSIEITSCLYKSLCDFQAEDHHNEWILWSDSCGGQNRNIRMTTFLLRLVHDEQLGIEKIIHRFPEPGHSFLPNDQDFGVIEVAKRLNRPFCSMQGYEDVVLKAMKNPSQFQIKRMKIADFIDFGLASTNFKNLAKPIDSKGEKFSWLEIKEFVYQRDKFGFYFCYDLNESHRFCNLGNPGGRSRRPKSHVFNDPKKAYNVDGIPLKQPKWKDLQKLLHFILPFYHDFYKSLPSDGNNCVTEECYPDELIDEEDQAFEDHE